MICPYCKEKLVPERLRDKPLWSVSCGCAEGFHEWLWVAEKNCLELAYKNSKDEKNGD